MSRAVCPMCHHANRPTARVCDECDYELGQSVDTLRGLLKTQLANARAMFWVLVVTQLALAGVVVLAVIYGFVIFAGLPFVFVAYQLVGAARKISITKHSLELVKQMELPTATVVSTRQR